MDRELLSKQKLEKPNLEELKNFAEALASKLNSNQVLLLKGDLGAGKTQFSRYFISAKGGKNIMSPSFAIENQYDIGTQKIHHFDLYRLEDDEEVESSGLWDSFQPGDIVIVEWAERIEDKYWPMDWELVDIQFSSDHSLDMQHYAALA